MYNTFSLKYFYTENVAMQILTLPIQKKTKEN